MTLQDEFSLFDPQKMRASVLPDKPGNYIIVLRSTSSLPIKVQISTTPILTSFDYKKEKYNVVYVGKSSKSLRIRDYKQHFTGTAGNSTIRKSLGCLLGFKLIPRDINSPQNGKTTFGEFDERTLTEWMKDNLLLFYYANNDYANVEKELIRTWLVTMMMTINCLVRKSDMQIRPLKLEVLSVSDSLGNICSKVVARSW